MKYKVNQEYLTLYIDELFDNKTIEDLFHYYHLSKKSIHLLKQNKEYFLNHQFVPVSSLLHKNDQLKIKAFSLSGIDFIPQSKYLDIIYEDDFLLIINKPSGMNVHPDKEKGTNSLCNIVANYYLENNLFYPVRYIHRLDYDTSGLIIFCKCQFIQAYLDYQLSIKQIKRYYLAVVEGEVKNTSFKTIQTYIARDRHQSGKMRVSKTGQIAITHYRLYKQIPPYSIVLCSLDTGRTHQIRVHLASIGHAIVGDKLYGQSSSKIKRQALHAYQIEFIHPITQKKLCIKCPLPKDMIF